MPAVFPSWCGQAMRNIGYCDIIFSKIVIIRTNWFNFVRIMRQIFTSILNFTQYVVLPQHRDRNVTVDYRDVTQSWMVSSLIYRTEIIDNKLSNMDGSVAFNRWHQCATPFNTGFLGPTRVHMPNGILIGSAVFAGLTIVTCRPTDRPTTDHATPSVTVGRIHVHVVLRCGLIIKYAVSI